MTGTLAGHALKRLCEIGAMAAEGKSNHLSPEAADHAARRTAFPDGLGAISADRVVCAGTVVPRAQREE